MEYRDELKHLLVDTYKGNLTTYSTEDAKEVIRNAFVDMFGSNNPDPRQFRRHKNEVFEIVEEVLDQLIVEGWKQDDFFMQFVEERNVNFGDKVEFYVPDRSLLTVSKVSNGHWDLRRQRLNAGDTVTVSTLPYAVAIYEDFYRVLSGRIDWAEFVDKVAKSFNQKIRQDIYDKFMGAIDYLPAEFRETGSYDEDKFVEIIQHVEASNGDRKINIAGTRKALRQVTGTADTSWSDKMKDERNQLGIVRYWEGYPLMPIKQVHKPGTFNFAVNDNRLTVLPADKPIKMVYEGGSQIKEVSDGLTNQDMSYEYMFVANLGIATIFNVLFGMYEIE